MPVTARSEAIRRLLADPARLSQIAAAAGPLRLRYTPLVPSPKQEAFLRLNTLEALFGGAAGPGKSTALLMAALQYCDVPGYAAILFRREYTELSLPGGLMAKAREWLDGSGARWSEPRKTWTFPSGATLTFGYLKTEQHAHRQKSAEYHYVGFDEVTELEEAIYTYLFSRIRRPIRTTRSAPDGMNLADIPLRVRGATNPGGPGEEWAHDRFVDPTTRRELAEEEDRPEPVFLPARFEDNPHLNHEEYGRMLAMLSPVERARLRDAMWLVNPAGLMFQADWFRHPAEYETARRARWWDFAATEDTGRNDPDYTANALLALTSDQQYVIEDIQQDRLSPAGVEDWFKTMNRSDPADVVWYVPQDPGSAGKLMVRQWKRLAPGRILRGQVEKNLGGDKEQRARPTSADAEHGLIAMLPGEWNRTATRQMARFPTKGAHDDIVDAVVGAHRMLALYAKRGAPSGTRKGYSAARR